MNRTDSSIADIARIMTEVHAKALRAEAQSQRLMEKSLEDMSMSSFLLTEAEDDGAALSEGDVNELKSSVDKMKSTLGSLADALKAAGGKFAKTQAAVEALAGDIPDPGTLAGMVIDPDPKAIAAETEKINTGISNAGSAAASILEAIKLFSDNLKDAVADVPDDLKTGKTLEELGEMASKGNLKTADGKEIKFPDVAKLKSGATKSVKVPSWFQQAFQSGMDSAKEEAGSFLGKVGSFFKGLFGKKQAGIDPATFADEIVKTTLEELAGVREAVGPIVDEMTETVTDSAGDAAAVQAGAAAAEAGVAPGSGGGGAEGADIKSWEDISTAVSAAVDDKASADEILKALAANDDFKTALKDKVNFGEANESRTRRIRPIHMTRLSDLLFEESVSFEEFVDASGVKDLGDDVNKEKVSADIAAALNKEVGEEVVTGIPEVEEQPADEPPPASEEEGAEEAEDAQSELEGAVQDAAGEGGSPGAAIMSAIDGWYDGLSDTSKKSMDSKDRIGGLRSNLQTAIDGAADTLAKAVGDAVSQWRGEHEETLVKSRRFAKKNFDSLEKLIPQLAGELLKKTDEAGVKLTRSMVKKAVYRFLDKKFMSQPLITEAFLPAANDLVGTQESNTYDVFDEAYEYTEDELIQYRWMRMAGLKEDTDD